MEYRTLGRSGLKVPPLCLGAMMFGGRTDEPVAAEIIARARDAGITFIDTADRYNLGASEQIVGRAVVTEREAFIIATKVGNPMARGPNGRGLSRRRLILACEASLKRLGTDWIDIYYLHREDPETPLEETVQALGDLIRAGKIRYFGVSNYRSWRLVEICRLCEKLGVPRPVVSQPYYNAFNRMPEVEHLPACAHLGLGVFSYSPLARGVLTGKYDPDKPPPADSRAGAGDQRILEAEWRPESLRLAQTIRQHAEARGISAGQFALAWVLNNRLITGVIAGPRTLEQWEEYVGALAYRFTAEDEALIDGMVAPGHPSSPGYNDPLYPLEGRIPRSGV